MRLETKNEGLPTETVNSSALSAAYLSFAELVGRCIAKRWAAHAKTADDSLGGADVPTDRKSIQRDHLVEHRRPPAE